MTQLTQYINSKFFLINRSELSERFDPYYFKEEFKQLRKKLTEKKFEKVGDFILSWNRGDGPRDGFYTDDTENGVYFLRVNNLKSNSIDLTDVKYINRSIHNTKLKRTQVKGGDLIFAISGTKDNLGTVSIIPNSIKEANLNSALVRLDLDLKKITKDFFCLLFELKFVRTQIEFIGKGAAQNNLNNSEIKSIQIPCLSIVKQEEIILFYNKILNQKQQKEAQAQELIKSIDTYLLNELGITLPIKNNTAKSRMFISNLSEVTSGRLDPDYQNISYKNIISEIKKSNFPIADLKDITEVLNSGKTPASYEYSEVKTDFPIIKVGSYTNDFINLEKVDFVLTKQRLKAQKGDIFILSAAHQSEYVGRHIKMLNEEPEIETSYVGELICVRANEKVNSIFLFSLLKTDIYKTLINREKTGQTSHVYGKDLKKIPIPLPNKQTQNKISEHINDIQGQIITLQADAKRILEEAKQEVEKMIIGN
ncbi:MAG: restriction endonuclease subunit S [Flavobacterium sp.]